MSTSLLLIPDLIGSSYMYKVRVPVGRLILELPAGMLDDENGDFVGTAAREVSLSLLHIIHVLECACVSVHLSYPFFLCM